MSGLSFILNEHDQKTFDALRGLPQVTAVVQRAVGNMAVVIVRTAEREAEFQGEDWAEALDEATIWANLRGR